MEIILDPYKQTNLKPTKGRILIAEPYLSQPDFSRSVVLLTEHGEDGTVGFALNRPTNLSLAEVLPDTNSDRFSIYRGGPVQPDTLHLLHRNHAQLGGSKVADRTYWGGSFNKLQDALLANQFQPKDLRLFVGYSGWAPGQLEEEIAGGAWLVADADPELLFSSTTDDMWHRAIKALGSEFAYLSQLPLNPQLN